MKKSTIKTITLLGAVLLSVSNNGFCPAQASATKTLYEKFYWACDREQWPFANSLLGKLISRTPKDAQLYSDRGRLGLEQRQFQKAVDDCTKAISLGLNDSSVHRRRGYCYLMLGDYKKGAADLEMALKLWEPDYEEMFALNDHANLARAYKLLGRGQDFKKAEKQAKIDEKLQLALDKRDTASLSDSMTIANEILKGSPNFMQAYFARAIFENNTTDFAKSIADLNKVLSVVPNAVPVLYFRADAYRETHEDDKAIKDYTKIIQLKPRLVMFDFAAHTGRIRDSFNTSDQVCINLADVYFLRGTCYYNLKKFDMAARDFADAGRLDPFESKAFMECGNCYFALYNNKAAIENYTKAIKIDPKMWDAYYQRAIAYEHSHDVPRAVADFTSVVTGNPREAGAYLLRGQVYERAGKMDEAIKDYGTMIKLAPSNDEGYKFRADLFAKLGKYKEAVADYDFALKVGSEDKAAIIAARDKARAAMRKGR
jgi:Tetratricopeptide repeat.